MSPPSAATVEISDAARLCPRPLVSVVMVTYNHEAWIAEAIEGVVGQDFDAGFELVIGEDCSSDGTREIVLDYQRRYPGLIRVLVSDRNVGPAANHARSLAAARGEFVAFCEGDDFWCHAGKLAAQARLLEERADAALVHSDWVRARVGHDGCWHFDPRHSEHSRLPLKRLQGDLFPVFYYGRLLRTCTLMIRRSAIEAYRSDSLSEVAYRFEDTVIAAFLTSRWQVAYWPEVSAVYRESPGSLLRSGIEAKIRFLRSALRFDDDARRRFAGRGDYPDSYRWENAVGLLAWGIRGRSGAVVREALADLASHFGPVTFVAAAWRALRMRWPGFRRRARTPSGAR